MTQLDLKPNHKAAKDYYLGLDEFDKLGVTHETAVRSSFQSLLEHCCRNVTDKRSGIVNDPNRQDDPQYIVKLIGKVITVSLETVKIVKSLPGI